VARALEHLADELPVMPGEEDVCHADARRADALVALASTSLAADPEPDRASVVVHAPLEALVSGEAGCELESGGLIHAETARRLLCSGRVQAVIENGQGHPVGVGRMTREPSAWMLRQLRYRDSECRFSGCGARRFTQAHHIVWWERGGRTDLDNLLLPLHVPSQAGARARMDCVPREGRDGRMVPSRRDPLSGSGAARRTLRTATSSRSHGVKGLRCRD
jgi:hypothetical protein